MEGSGFTVRLPAVGDAAAMAEVHIATWRAAYAGVFPDDYLAGLDHDRFTNTWETNIADAAATTNQGVTHLVGEIDGVVRGILTVGPFRDRSEDSDPSGELWMINLHPDAHGSGLAKVLHDRGLDRLRSDGHHRAALWVADANRRARRFYEREGWTGDGIAKQDSFGDRVIAEVRYSISL